jgi:hypothetical protein
MSMKGQRTAVLYDVLPGETRTESADEYALHVKLLPQPGLDEEALDALTRTGGEFTYRLRISGDTIVPISMTTVVRTRSLDGRAGDLFRLHRCA